jgi:hypothetical protein
MARTVESFVAQLSQDLANVTPPGAPVKRRMATICTSSGRKLTQPFVDELHRCLKGARIHSDLKKTCAGQSREDWITFSKTALRTKPALFSKEKALTSFVLTQIGVAEPFDGLRLLPLSKGPSFEFPVLVNGRRCRVDLLCMDRNSGRSGGYVALEFKRGHDSAVIEQVKAYLDALAKRMDRPVRAIIVSGDEHEAKAQARRPDRDPRIDWMYYSVKFLPAIGQD